MLPAKSIPCSILILTRNSAGTLERCLRNLAPFQEILIHDANSEDDSVRIAQAHGARVLKQYDTDEKSVRVKDFTAMRLKERADASFDWVLYLDSDEYLSDELVEELSGLIPSAAPKTIIKFRRVPVVNGIPRTRGNAFPEVMPRIHHRRSGATLRTGKVVHEKYEYDGSFAEVVARYPLYVPLDPVADLRSKDDRYILLEVERMRREHYPFTAYFRWFLLREPLIMLACALRVFTQIPFSFSRESLPLGYGFRFVRYHWRIFRAVTGLMAERLFTRGRP